MIHYHGGVLHVDAVHPIEFVGRCFCVSYAYPQHVELYHQIGQSVCLDNGAFSLWSQRKKTDWQAFYDWATPWLEYQTTWAIIPDVIEGDDKDNDRLVDEWPFSLDKGAPVWHPHESLERLARLRDDWSLICIGGSAEYKTIGTPKWLARMAEAMDTLCDDDGLPMTRIHLLRGLRYSAGPFPLWSADSASVARSWSGSPTGQGAAPKPVWQMMAAVDGRNPPSRWENPGVQHVVDVGADKGSYTMEYISPEEQKEYADRLKAINDESERLRLGGVKPSAEVYQEKDEPWFDDAEGAREVFRTGVDACSTTGPDAEVGGVVLVNTEPLIPDFERPAAQMVSTSEQAGLINVPGARRAKYIDGEPEKPKPAPKAKPKAKPMPMQEPPQARVPSGIDPPEEDDEPMPDDVREHQETESTLFAAPKDSHYNEGRD